MYFNVNLPKSSGCVKRSARVRGGKTEVREERDVRKIKTDPSLESLAAKLDGLGKGQGPPRGVIDIGKWLKDSADTTADRIEEIFDEIEAK